MNNATNAIDSEFLALLNARNVTQEVFCAIEYGAAGYEDARHACRLASDALDAYRRRMNGPAAPTVKRTPQASW